MSQIFRKNILIICEGSTTEPNYFDNLRDLSLKQLPEYQIKIRPLPESAKIEVAQASSATQRQGRKSRQMNDVVVKEQPIPEEYAAQPLRYVWEAQQGLVDETYDEVWAVFDLDEHPKHAEAFALSKETIKGKSVQIAFSSISFETWILLHFEYNVTAFEKSQCRTQRELHHCGQDIHEHDCHGERCVTGYLKIKDFVEKQKDIKKIRFHELQDKIAIALKNAVSLRATFPANQPIYEINPITTVDRLVFKLLHSKFDFQWRDIDSVTIHGRKATVTKHGGVLTIVVRNLTDTCFILLPTHLLLFNTKGESILVGRKELLDPQSSSSSQVIDLTTLQNFEPTYLGFEIKDGVSGIAEIPVN